MAPPDFEISTCGINRRSCSEIHSSIGLSEVARKGECWFWMIALGLAEVWTTGCAADVINLEVEGGRGFTFEELKNAVETHKPAVLFLCQVRQQQQQQRALGFCCMP